MPEELHDWKPKERDYDTEGPTSSLLRMKVCREFGLTPHVFEKRDYHEQAKMIAIYLADRIVECYNSQSAETHAKAKAKKKTKKNNHQGYNSPKPRDPRMSRAW